MTFFWVMFPLLLACSIFQQALMFAPMAFWRGLDEKNSKLAFFLWGYSHLFGPRLKAGKTKPWYLEDHS